MAKLALLAFAVVFVSFAHIAVCSIFDLVVGFPGVVIHSVYNDWKPTVRFRSIFFLDERECLSIVGVIYPECLLYQPFFVH